MEIKIKLLQLYWPYFSNNLFENNTLIAFRPVKPNKSLNFLYL